MLRQLLHLKNVMYLTNGGMMIDDDDVDLINLNTVKELQTVIAERDAIIERLRAALDSVLGLAEAQVMNTSNVPQRIYGKKLITDALVLLRKEE